VTQKNNNNANNSQKTNDNFGKFDSGLSGVEVDKK